MKPLPEYHVKIVGFDEKVCKISQGSVDDQNAL